MTDTLDPTAQVFRQTQQDDAGDAHDTPPYRPGADEIAAEAYAIYHARGTDGLDLDDWLEAERRLIAQRSLFR